MFNFGRQNTKSIAFKAGLAGAIIGAAGAAVGMAMSDKNKREKLKKSLHEVKKWSQERMNSPESNSSDESTETFVEEAKREQSRAERDKK